MDVTHHRTAAPLDPALAADPRLAELAAWGRRLTDLGVAPGASGNLSCRTEAGFVITATGVPLGGIGAEHWVVVTDVTPLDDGGLEVHSQGLYQPSKDSSVHLATYRRLPRAAAVFHLHPVYLDALTGRLGVPTTSRYFPAGTVESVLEIERFLDEVGEVEFFVLVDHGVVSVAESIDAAGETVERFHRAVTQPVAEP